MRTMTPGISPSMSMPPTRRRRSQDACRSLGRGWDDRVHALNFGMIGDDDEDGGWRIIEVSPDDGKYLSEVLAPK
jgi:hypothetical protein